jgi:hypothetical protein
MRERESKNYYRRGPEEWEKRAQERVEGMWTQSKHDICTCENTVKPIKVCNLEKFKRQQN